MNIPASKKIKVVAAHADRVCPEVIGEDTAHITLKAESGAVGTVAGNFCAVKPLKRTGWTT